MRRAVPTLLVTLAVAALAAEPTVPELVARLRSENATYNDWVPIAEAGKAAIPELRKLLADPSDSVRAAAAVLLYRAGEASALDVLDKLLESKDAAAAKEAAEALAAFTGGPAACGEALAAWRAWWKTNREKALAAPPLGSLHGKITGVDSHTGYVVMSLSARHGASRGMRINVRRGSQFVCLIELTFASAKGSVGRLVALSGRGTPQAGDTCFWMKP